MFVGVFPTSFILIFANFNMLTDLMLPPRLGSETLTLTKNTTSENIVLSMFYSDERTPSFIFKKILFLIIYRQILCKRSLF